MRRFKGYISPKIDEPQEDATPFTSFNEGTYRHMMRASTSSIVNLLRPGVHYKNVPMGSLICDFYYDEEDFHYSYRSILKGDRNSKVVTKEDSLLHGFSTIQSSIRYFLQNLTSSIQEPVPLTLESLNEIYYGITEVLRNPIILSPTRYENTTFFYADVMFEYVTDTEPKRYRPGSGVHTEIIQWLKTDPYGHGGSSFLTSMPQESSYEVRNKSVLTWVEYLEREGYPIEPIKLSKNNLHLVNELPCLDSRVEEPA